MKRKIYILVEGYVFKKLEEKRELLFIDKKSEGTYQKPERPNKNIPDAKYDKIDKTCEEEVFLSNDGNVYVSEDSMRTVFNTDTKIYDNFLDDDDKRCISGTNAVKSFTHKEIHRRNIRTGEELEKQEEDIKRTVARKK